MAENYRVEEIPNDADTLGGKSAEEYQQEIDFLHEQVGNKRQYSIINEAKDTLIHLADTVKGDMIISDCAIVPQTGYEIISCGKNLLNNQAESTIINGVTLTLNEDKSVTASGTASMDLNLSLTEVIKNTFVGKDLIMSWNEFEGVCVVIEYYDEDYAWQKTVTCNNGVIFNTENYPNLMIRLKITGDTVVDTTFYPMLRFAEDTDKTYEPYVESRVTVNVDSELPLYGLKSFDKSTTILNDYNSEMTVQYALNETGASILSFSDRLTKLEAKVEAHINA